MHEKLFLAQSSESGNMVINCHINAVLPKLRALEFWWNCRPGY